MPLRIHFTTEDMARTRLAEGPRPLVELHMGLRVLQEAGQPLRFGGWRRHARAHLHPCVRRLLDLVPAGGWSPDFFLAVRSADPREALETVRATTRSYLRQDLDQWSRLQPDAPAWTRRIGTEPRLFQHLVDVLGHAHEQVIAQYWPHIESAARTDRVLRLRHLADHGVEGLLTRLNPRRLRWTPPVLEADTEGGADEEIHLDGRGMLLIPSLFRSSYPVVDRDARPQPWMTFPLRAGEHLPVLPPEATAAALNRTPGSLAALLGRTRAAVLCAIADHPGCTTTELARHAGIAPASASEHATVLRTAGLTDVTRHANTALHLLTGAGETLLGAPSGGRPPT